MRSGKAVGTNVPAQTALAYRTAAGEILGEIPANEMPATNTGPSGLGLEPRMRAILEERFPRSQFRYNSGPGGPDVDWVGGEDPGFDALDFKPDTVDQHYKARKQFREWGGEGWKGRVAPPTFRAAICAYMSDGTLYIRDIAVVGRDYLKGLW
jgi:hypothetical protein